DEQQHGAREPREEAEHPEPVWSTDRPTGHRPDARRDRPAETHVVALERRALRHRHGSADRNGVAFDPGARQGRDGAPDRPRLTPNVARDRDRAADGYGLVDGLVGSDVERSAELHALRSMTTAAFTASLAPGVAGRCSRVRTNPQHSVGKRGA